MSAPRPYLRRAPVDLIQASDWNEVQRRFELELAAHDHTGGERGAQLGGESFDPDSTLTARAVHVRDRITVGGVDLSADPTELRPGETLSTLKVSGDLRVLGKAQSPPPPGAWGARTVVLEGAQISAPDANGYILQPLGITLAPPLRLVTITLSVRGQPGSYLHVFRYDASKPVRGQSGEGIDGLGDYLRADGPLGWLRLSGVHEVSPGGDALFLYASSCPVRPERVVVEIVTLAGGAHG